VPCPHSQAFLRNYARILPYFISCTNPGRTVFRRPQLHFHRKGSARKLSFWFSNSNLQTQKNRVSDTRWRRIRRTGENIPALLRYVFLLWSHGSVTRIVCSFSRSQPFPPHECSLIADVAASFPSLSCYHYGHLLPSRPDGWTCLYLLKRNSIRNLKMMIQEKTRERISRPLSPHPPHPDHT
jgi:hypothetical protein